MGVVPLPCQPINNWTLAFLDPQIEHDFKVHQRRVWDAGECWRLKLNTLAGLTNLSITTYALSQASLLTNQRQVYMILLPYLTVALLHACLATRLRGSWKGVLVNHVAEVCYSLICTLSMPTWVLHGTCLDLKDFSRKLILGSGVLIGIWVRFLTPTFSPVACVLTPAQFAFQAWHLTQPTCTALLAQPYSQGVTQDLLHSLAWFARWALHGAASGAARSTPSTPSLSTDLSCGCHRVLYALQILSGSTLLLIQYRMERANRKAFLQSKVQLLHGWPRVPAVVQAVLTCVVYMQASAVLWVVMVGGQAGSACSRVDA